MALNRLGLDYESVGISEIDKYAIQSYAAIHTDFLDYKEKLLKNVTKSELKGNKLKKQLDKKASEYAKNFGSICDIKGFDLPQIDVFTWSFPCTDLSKAGKQSGLQGGTRSGLVYEVLRIMQECKVNGNLPKVLIMENVVDLVQVKFIREFQDIQLELEQLGYSNYTQKLNAKDYGVAQNRDRVFMVSILGDYYYEFPKPIKLEKRLKDYLESEVDEKYYLEEKELTKFGSYYTWKDNNGNINTQCNRAADENEYALTVACANTGNVSIRIPEATSKGYSEAYDGDGVYINRPHQKSGVVQDGMIQTLKTSCSDVGVVVDKKIITPLFMFDLCVIIDEKDIYKYEKSRKLLRILWEEIGKEEIWEEIRRLFSVYEKEVLQQRLYEEKLCNDRAKQPKLLNGSCNIEKDKRIVSTQRSLRDLWGEFKCRYTPQRWELEEQQFRKFDLFMSKLPYENTSKNKQCLQDMWEQNGIFGVLQQTLYSLQEIWKSDVHKIQYEGLAIRKLMPIEVWRLMGINDEDFNKASKVCSRSQLYRQAGNGIVVDVFASLLSTMKGQL